MAASATFTEREPYERGFAEVFDRDIAPRLDDLEAERVDRFAKRKVRLKITYPAFPKYRRYSVRREGDSAIRIMKL